MTGPVAGEGGGGGPYRGAADGAWFHAFRSASLCGRDAAGSKGGGPGGGGQRRKPREVEGKIGVGFREGSFGRRGKRRSLISREEGGGGKKGEKKC